MVLVFAENQNGQFKKAALEAVYYGSKTAEAMGSSCHAIVIGNVDNAAQLGQYGAQQVHHVSGDAFANFDSQMYSKAITEVAQKISAKVVVVSHSSSGKALIGRLAVRLDAGSVAGVNSLPTVSGNGIKVKKNVFSGKAIAEYEIAEGTAVLSLMGNTLKPEAGGSDATVEAVSIEGTSTTEIVSVDLQQGSAAPLPEAELVVSAGRGMKGPENWGIIDDLANALGATTACSRPVADTGWRPHHEHVGQTGVAIRPNLYIAAGISGAIQHLAGVNSSKCIVVINKDPEAPFFKAADYGVVGDLFDVVPRLTEALKKVKG
jgi:electron transfer flavoprotein alpha subunit